MNIDDLSRRIDRREIGERDRLGIGEGDRAE